MKLGELTSYRNPVSGERGNIANVREDLALIKGVVVLGAVAAIGMGAYNWLKGKVNAEVAKRTPASPVAPQAGAAGSGGWTVNA